MNFKFNIEYELEDYYKFNKFHNSKTPQGKRMIWTFRLIFALLFGIIIISSAINGDYFTAITFFIALTLFELIFGPIFGHSLKRQIRKLAQQKEKGYLTSVALEFSDDFIKETSEASILEQKYSIVYAVYAVADEAIYVYNSKTSAYILPKRFFESEKEYHEFLEFIKTKYQNVKFFA